MIDISYILGMKKERKASGEPLDIEGNLSITEDESGFIVIDEEDDNG